MLVIMKLSRARMNQEKVKRIAHGLMIKSEWLYIYNKHLQKCSGRYVVRSKTFSLDRACRMFGHGGSAAGKRFLQMCYFNVTKYKRFAKMIYTSSRSVLFYDMIRHYHVGQGNTVICCYRLPLDIIRDLVSFFSL